MAPLASTSEWNPKYDHLSLYLPTIKATACATTSFTLTIVTSSLEACQFLLWISFNPFFTKQAELYTFKIAFSKY